jgi:small-conductance mechanosensitive channel
VLSLLALRHVLPLMELPDDWALRFSGLLKPMIVICFGWLLVAGIRGFAAWVNSNNAWATISDNLAARRIHTQVKLITRVVNVVIILLTIIGVVLTIPSLRNVGLSLFASAGVAGIALGMAARPALSNIIAGIQLALTQPIRIDDVVIVEGQYSWVEEINTSYVVLRIWDLRRMIVPLSYFIEKPFENWTHTNTNLLGTAILMHY